MKIIRHNNKPILNFLMNRWRYLSPYGALERVFRSSQDEPEIQELLIQCFSRAIRLGSTKEISMIKQRITEIVPKTEFILPDYEALAPLDADDFMELYISHQHISLEKLKDVIGRTQIK